MSDLAKDLRAAVEAAFVEADTKMRETYRARVASLDPSPRLEELLKVQVEAQSFVCQAVRAALLKLVEGERCDWREDDDGNWDTACGNAFTVTAGTPKENSMYYCCYCGGQLAQHDYATGGQR